MSNMWWNFKQMRESALGSVFIFQKRAIGLDNYKGKESLSRVVVILFVSVASGQSVEILFVFKSPFWTKKIQKCGILPFEKSPFSLYKQNK